MNLKKLLLIGWMLISSIFLFSTSISSQCCPCGENYRIRSESLSSGIYNPKKVVRNSFKVFYNEEADTEFEKVLLEDEGLRKIFVQEIIDDDGNMLPIREEEIFEYYPELGVIIKGGGHGYVSVFDIRNKKDLCGNPMTYAYSPSRTYRLSALNVDGMHYYLEEKIGDEYACLGSIDFEGDISGYYWVDEKTIHYLREHQSAYGSKYWIAYSSEFYLVKAE